MAEKRTIKKILKITAYVLGGIFVLFAAFHFWFVSHAKGLLKNLVEKKTQGRMKLEIDKLSYNYFNRKMTIRNAVLYSTDTNTANTAYRFSIKQINIELQALLPFAVQKKLLIDSLHLQSPNITVTQLRYAADTVKIKDTGDVSLPYEMGKIYNSIQDALKELNVEKFRIADGQFNLVNKARVAQKPVHISNIDFRIENLKVDGSGKRGKEKILFSDNVILNSTNQDIVFPDGRHLLSFKNFHIDLKKKEVVFDSCIISAAKTDKNNGSFSVFFDKLRLADIDFDTLYKNEVIKADTVFCLNPRFTLRVDVSSKKDSASRPPKLETIIRQLTGDMSLNHVIVDNASFDITTIKNGVPSSFTSNGNSFAMSGLGINQDEKKPVRVQNFAMAIRNYENFIKDSTYRLQFDSILFRDDKIYLSNFLFNKLDNGRIINTFNIPQFFLEGLSWDDLVFEKRLKARRAYMMQPHIQYTSSPHKRKERQNVFQSMEILNDYMELEQLNIVEGHLDLRLKKGLQVQLENASLSVQSQALLNSTRLSGIKNSLNNMRFDKGVLRVGDLFIQLDNISYTGSSGQFTAGHIAVKNKKNDLKAILDDVLVDKMIVDEKLNSIVGEGIRWRSADINIIPGPGSQDGKPGTTINLKNIHGTNTTLGGTFGNRKILTKVDEVTLTELNQRPGSKIILNGLAARGKQLRMEDAHSLLAIAAYDFRDNEHSTFSQVKYKLNSPALQLALTIPGISAVPHLKELLAGNIAIDNVNLPGPVLDIEMTAGNAGVKGSWELPELNINQINLSQPVIHFTERRDSGSVIFNWNGALEKNTLKITGLNARNTGNDISIKEINARLSDILFTNGKGKTFNSGKGEITAGFRDISIIKQANELVKWHAVANHVNTTALQFDSVGKEKGTLVIKALNFENFGLSSSSIKDLRKIVAANPSFRIGRFSGQYDRSSANIYWDNAGFSRSGNVFTVDSFSLKPSMEADSFFSSKKFQSDYVKIGMSNAWLGALDIDKYIDQGIMDIKKVVIANAWFTDIKDRSFPFNAGIIKPLPVQLLKDIVLQMNIDSMRVDDARIEYTEINEKTRQQGIVPLKLKIELANIKNYELGEKDSLFISAAGYLIDSIPVSLTFKQSYEDTLSGFLMNFSGQPGDLRRLNKVLIPLASLKILSGRADSLEMRAIGREYLALGKMRMPYSDLKIQILKNGEEKDQKKFLTFLANAFIIKKNNKSGEGNVFFIRKRDRSALNYLVKILLSGMASTTGAKSNKKMIRQYEKEREKRGLPPIDLK